MQYNIQQAIDLSNNVTRKINTNIELDDLVKIAGRSHENFESYVSVGIYPNRNGNNNTNNMNHSTTFNFPFCTPPSLRNTTNTTDNTEIISLLTNQTTFNFPFYTSPNLRNTTNTTDNTEIISLLTNTNSTANTNDLIEIIPSLTNHINSNNNIIKDKETEDDLDIEIEPGKECSICMADIKTMAGMPCGHLCVCMKCSKKINKCPICNNKTTNFVRIFLS